MPSLFSDCTRPTWYAFLCSRAGLPDEVHGVPSSRRGGHRARAAFAPQANAALRPLQAAAGSILSYCSARHLASRNISILRISLHLPCEYWGLTCNGTIRHELLIKLKAALWFILIHKAPEVPLGSFANTFFRFWAGNGQDAPCEEHECL